MRAALTELSGSDAPDAETWLEDENGYVLVVFGSGRVALLGPDSEEICHRKRVSHDQALELWQLLQEGRRDEIKQRLAASAFLKRNVIPGIVVLLLSLLYLMNAPHNSDDPIA